MQDAGGEKKKDKARREIKEDALCIDASAHEGLEVSINKCGIGKEVRKRSVGCFSEQPSEKKKNQDRSAEERCKDLILGDGRAEGSDGDRCGAKKEKSKVSRTDVRP